MAPVNTGCGKRPNLFMGTLGGSRDRESLESDLVMEGLFCQESTV